MLFCILVIYLYIFFYVVCFSSYAFRNECGILGGIKRMENKEYIRLNDEIRNYDLIVMVVVSWREGWNRFYWGWSSVFIPARNTETVPDPWGSPLSQISMRGLYSRSRRGNLDRSPETNQRYVRRRSGRDRACINTGRVASGNQSHSRQTSSATSLHESIRNDPPL